jgi:hypothetical protein
MAVLEMDWILPWLTRTSFQVGLLVLVTQAPRFPGQQISLIDPSLTWAPDFLSNG